MDLEDDLGGSKPLCAVYRIIETSVESEIDRLLGDGLLDSGCSISSLYHNVPNSAESTLRSIIMDRVKDGSVVPNYSSILEEKFIDDQNEASEAALYLMAFRPEPISKESNSKTTITVVLLHEDVEILRAFQGEMDAFLSEIVDDLCAEQVTLPPELADKVSLWYFSCVEYLPRIVTSFGSHLGRLLVAILCGQIPVLEPQNASVLADIRRFAQFCSDTWLECDKATAESQFVVRPEGDRLTTTLIDSTEFTNEWAHVLQKLVDGAASPPTVKELTLAFKHKAFRDLNVLQRLLAAAQNDHYALFRTVEFLRKTHNIPLLLKLVSKQPELSSAQRKLINLLDEYLKKYNLSSLF